jgi:hypothetical protein
MVSKERKMLASHDQLFTDDQKSLLKDIDDI